MIPHVTLNIILEERVSVKKLCFVLYFPRKSCLQGM